MKDPQGSSESFHSFPCGHWYESHFRELATL